MLGKEERKKTTSSASAPDVSNEAILATIAKQGVNVAKLVDDLKISMEGCLDKIDLMPFHSSERAS